ncbi:MAG: hypothetical protein DRO67_10510 [Candidatus Asgardarchaeum californiense]|nr:MAG: hypothetical protein DRO67_10510 [Candidatus Asgardarchaeum californiense]
MNRCSIKFHKYVKIDEHISIQQIMDKIVASYDPLLQAQVRDCILEMYNVIQPEVLAIRYPGRKVCIKCGKVKNKILKHGEKMLKAVNKKKFSKKKKYLRKCKAKKLFLLDRLDAVKSGSELEEKIKGRILELDETILNLTEGFMKNMDVEVRAILRKL